IPARWRPCTWPSSALEAGDETSSLPLVALARRLHLDAVHDGEDARQPPEPGRDGSSRGIAALRRRKAGGRGRGVRRPAASALDRGGDAPGRRARQSRPGPLRADRLRRKRDEDHPGPVTMRSLTRMGATAFLAGTALACAQQKTMYRWGGYDDALYRHYKNPQERDEFVAKLQGVIEEAEKTGGVVPPGCYAEYGWALYEEGRGSDAIAYFEKESKQWPESRPFMEKLIKNVARAKPPPPAAAPTAVPASSTGEEKK